MAGRSVGRLLYSKLQSNILNSNQLAASVRLMSSPSAEPQGMLDFLLFINILQKLL